MEKDSGKIFSELKQDLLAYAELKLELLKLSTYERSGQLIAILSYGLILLFFAFFAILFIFLALGLFLGDAFDSIGAGFVVVAGLYILLIGLVVLCKKKVCRMIVNIVLAALNDNDDNDDATDQQHPTDTAGEIDF